MGAGLICVSGLHSMLCLIISMARSEISLVTILAIVAVTTSCLSSVGGCPFSRLVKNLHVASLKAGWYLSAKSRQMPGMSPFDMYAASRLKVPLPDIKSRRVARKGVSCVKM